MFLVSCHHKFEKYLSVTAVGASTASAGIKYLNTHRNTVCGLQSSLKKELGQRFEKKRNKIKKKKR